MEKPLTITAVCGWALPPRWFRDHVRLAFPTASIRVIYPENPAEPSEARELLQAAPADLTIGYSLGSLWLLQHRQYIPPGGERVLLAPILGFTREQNKAGNTSKSQLKYLIKLLKTKAEDNSPLPDFYTDCKISIPERYFQDIPDRAALIHGLQFLESASVDSAQGFFCIVGENDHLLVVSELQSLIPDLDIVAGAGHAPENLLQRLAARRNFRNTV